MYKLTLTRSERKAIDWIGDRYRHGHELYTLLCRGEWTIEDGTLSGDWDCENELTITMPEHVAWEVRDLIEDSSEGVILPCLAIDFCVKLVTFCDCIV